MPAAASCVVSTEIRRTPAGTSKDTYAHWSLPWGERPV